MAMERLSNRHRGEDLPLGAIVEKHPPRQELKRIIAEQVNRLVALGFHKELGKSKKEYRDDFKLPEGTNQSEAYKGRFDVLLIVDPRISLARQHTLAGIREFIDTGKIRNLTTFPETPYAIWTHDGRKYISRTVEAASESFKRDEVRSPQIEVTALYLQHPEFFRGRGIDAAGSRFGDGTPFLYAFGGRPRVDARWIGPRDPLWGSGSRGKETIKLGI